jgi:hypothetical protein
MQRYKGYKEDTTAPSLENFGLDHDTMLPFIKKLYGMQPEGEDRSSLEAELESCCMHLCQKYHITALYITPEALLEQVKAEMVSALLDTIEDGISPSTLDAKQIAGLQEQFAQAFGMQAAHCWGPRTGWKTLQYTRNWTPAGTKTLIIEPDKAYLSILPEQAPPPGEAPTLTITIALSQVTGNDLERLTWEFKEVVKKALQSLPTNRITDPDAVETALLHTVHGIVPTQPSTARPTLTVVLDCSKVNQRYLQRLEEKFKTILRAACDQVAEEGLEHKLFRWKEFIRDVRRYDWHMQEGLSFRVIAFQELTIYENAHQRGQTLEEPLALPTPLITRDDLALMPWEYDSSKKKAKYKESMPGEASVTQGIKNIYQAIHRQPYPTVGIEPDKATLDSSKYRCPYHPPECPPDCSYAPRWFKSIRKWLPTDYRGGSMEVPVSNALLDTRRYSPAFRGVYGVEEYGDMRQDGNGDEMIVDDQTGTLLFDAFEDHVHLGWYTGESAGDDHGASVEDMDYLSAWEDEGYLEYPEELQ